MLGQLGLRFGESHDIYPRAFCININQQKNWAARNQRSIVFCAILTFTVAQELTPKSAKP